MRTRHGYDLAWSESHAVISHVSVLSSMWPDENWEVTRYMQTSRCLQCYCWNGGQLIPSWPHRMLPLPVIWVHGRQPPVLWGWGCAFRSYWRRRALGASVAAVIAVQNMWSHHIQQAIDSETMIGRCWSTGRVSLLQLWY